MKGNGQRATGIGFVALGFVLCLTASAQAQQGPTTLGAVIVTAERSATPMNRSTAATTKLTAADLAALPNASLADVLARVPGFAVVTFDGLGRDPQLMVRGFYGGGEADYVLVKVDGRVMNLAHNGTIAWETLPSLTDIESIEIVRGSASALHGDAAVAGVINIVTRRPSTNGATWRVGAESMMGLQASGMIADTAYGAPFNASAGIERTDGFRDNAGRQLKAIPGQLLSTGVTISPPRLGTLTVSVTRMADMFIDDANTRRIPSWTRVDAQASRTLGAFDVVLGARNLFDTRINSTGFLDPAGSGEAYWYPAAGRVITLGVRHGK